MPPTTTKITNNHLSLISFNINRLNSPIKIHEITDWIIKLDPAFCYIHEKKKALKNKKQKLLQNKRLENIFPTNGSKKQDGVAILISSEIDFQPKIIKEDWEGHFIFNSGKIHQDSLNSEHLCPKGKDIHIHKRNFIKSKKHTLNPTQ
jgi:exonuclease III